LKYLFIVYCIWRFVYGNPFLSWNKYTLLLAYTSKYIFKIAFKMVELEHNFIDLIYGPDTEICNLKKDDVKNYIRYLANIRWKQLGFNSDIYTILKNPLPWVDYMVNGEEHANFFESKSTFYSKAMTEGTMEDIKW